MDVKISYVESIQGLKSEIIDMASLENLNLNQSVSNLEYFEENPKQGGSQDGDVANEVELGTYEEANQELPIVKEEREQALTREPVRYRFPSIRPYKTLDIESTECECGEELSNMDDMLAHLSVCSLYSSQSSQNTSNSRKTVAYGRNGMAYGKVVQELQDPLAAQSSQSNTELCPTAGVSTPPSGGSTLLTPDTEAVCNDLRDLLQKSTEHKIRKLAKGRKLQKESDVRLLCRKIVDHLLHKAAEEDRENCRVSYVTFSRWAAAVSLLFPRESKDTWFRTQQIERNGVVTKRPFGKLWERYNNCRRTFTVDGTTVRRKSRAANTPASLDEGGGDSSSDSPRPSTSGNRKSSKENLPSRLLAAERKKVLWDNKDFKVVINIGSDRSQADDLTTAFAACREQRLDYLKVVSLAEYLDDVNALRLPHLGQILLDGDFRYLQPTVDSRALLKGLNDYRDAIKIEAMLVTKRLRGSAKAPLQKLLKYYDSTGEDATRNSVALLLLPLIVKGAHSHLGTRISAALSAEYFVLRSESLASAEEAILKRRPAATPTTGSETSSNNTVKRGRESKPKQFEVHPLVIAIGGSGEDWESVESYLVYVNQVLYSVENLVTAVDLCFKCCYAFDLHYSPECENVWQALQLLFYDIHPSNQRIISGVRDFVARIKHTSEKIKKFGPDSQEPFYSSDSN